MRIDLQGTRALVTAGASGIGLATATALAAAGAEVDVCDIDETALAELPDALRGHRCDVASSAAVDALFQTVLAAGPLDILVNNAGVAGPTAAVEEITDEAWRSMMAVNLDAAFFCTRRVVPGFKAQGRGVIVNLLSTAGLYGYPTRTPYVASKFALRGMTETLAMELGPHGVRVNGVAPGSVNGDRMERVIAAHAEAEGITTDEVRRLYEAGVSMQTFVDPEEIADTIVFLCSEQARHISGQMLAIDGNTETLWPRL